MLADGAPLNGAAVLADGSVTLTTSFPAGMHTLTAAYRGDSNADGSSSAPLLLNVQPNPTTTTVSLQGGSLTAFQPVLAAVHTSSLTAPGITPDGATVVAVLNAGAISAQAANAPPVPAGTPIVLGAGTFSILASYTPATPPANFLPSRSAPQAVVIARAPSFLTVSGAPSQPVSQSQAVALAVQASGVPGHAPTGNVDWTVDGTPAGSSAVGADGAATLSMGALSGGTHTFVLTYEGDANYLPASTAPVSIQVIQRDFLVSHDPSISVVAQHHGSMTVKLSSLGDFAGDVQLSCAGLPQFATCSFDKAALNLTAGSSSGATLTLETDQFPGYVARVEEGQGASGSARRLATLAAFSPLALFALFAARRHRAALRLLQLAAALLLTLGSLTLMGCGARTPGFTAPGTYSFQIVAASPNVTHSQSVTLVITSK